MACSGKSSFEKSRKIGGLNPRQLSYICVQSCRVRMTFEIHFVCLSSCAFNISTSLIYRKINRDAQLTFDLKFKTTSTKFPVRPFVLSYNTCTLHTHPEPLLCSRRLALTHQSDLSNLQNFKTSNSTLVTNHLRGYKGKMVQKRDEKDKFYRLLAATVAAMHEKVQFFVSRFSTNGFLSNIVLAWKKYLMPFFDS